MLQTQMPTSSKNTEYSLALQKQRSLCVALAYMRESRGSKAEVKSKKPEEINEQFRSYLKKTTFTR